MGKIISNGIEYSGGDFVEANPTGTATVILNTIKIGDTIYSLPSGGDGVNTLLDRSLTPTVAVEEVNE